MNNRFIDKARGRRRQVRVRGYMRDRGMHDYEMDSRRSRRRDYEMDSRRDYGQDYRRDYGQDYRRNDYNMNDGHYRHEMPSYSMYGQVMPYDYGRDYGRDYRDYDYDDEDDDYASGEEEYKKELEKWSHKLKQHDRFNINKEEVIKKAKEMQVQFNDFNEDEFYAIYLLYLSMHKNQFNDPHMYIKMAKDFLSYQGFKLNPSETVWVMLNDIVLGKEGE